MEPEEPYQLAIINEDFPHEFELGQNIKIDDVSGELLCSSKMGVNSLDLFNHVMTDETDLRSFLGPTNYDDNDKLISLAIKSYLKFCSETKTEHWQVGKTELSEAEVYADYSDSGDSDKEYYKDDSEYFTRMDIEIKKSKKNAVKSKQHSKKVDGAAREILYENVVKCCRVCYPDNANSLAQLSINESITQVSKILSEHMYNAHNICDTFYKETEYKTQVLNLLKDENLKDDYEMLPGGDFKCKLCPGDNWLRPIKAVKNKNRGLQLLKTAHKFYVGLHLKYHRENYSGSFEDYVKKEVFENSFTHSCQFENCDYKFKCDFLPHDKWMIHFWPLGHDNVSFSLDFYLPNPFKYRNHWHFVHRDSGFFACEFCTEIFDSKKKFQKHQATHDTSLQLQCAECGKMCLTKEKLRAHTEYAHTDKYDHKCKQCGPGLSIFKLWKPYFCDNFQNTEDSNGTY